MNKTVNINLGGMFFHIDEDAYQKLTRYFDAIKRSLSNSSGQDEIIKDIEMRIAELISEKHTNDKQVINLKELDEIIAVMGQPEDYRIEDENPQEKTNTYQDTKKSKKLYRDTDKGMIGGVAAGLGHYFGIDAVWIRVILVLLVIAGFGTGILAYIILWAVTPEARTTSEKLEMNGEPVTISNIEKKVREEFETVSEKIKNVDYDKYGNQIKSGAGKVGNSLGNLIIAVLKAFSKFIGVLFIISGLFVLISLFIGVFTLGTFAFIDFPWSSFIESGNFTDYPVWSFGVLMFFAVGIPFFFLTVLGFKLVSPSIKSIGNSAKYTLLALWLISISLAIIIGIKQASAFSADGRVVKKETINIKPTDTLFIKFIHSDYFAKDINDRNDFKITQDSSKTDIIYSNNVSLKIEKTEANLPYIKIEKEAKGKSFSEAKERAEQIKYAYKIVGNQLILDNYLLTDLKNKFRDQEVEITLYLPKGTLFKVDSSLQDYDHSDNDFFNLHFSSNDFIYKVENNQVKCLNCPEDENEYNDSSTDSNDSTATGIIINKDGILIKATKETKDQQVKIIKIDKNGVNIKTN